VERASAAVIFAGAFIGHTVEPTIPMNWWERFLLFVAIWVTIRFADKIFIAVGWVFLKFIDVFDRSGWGQD
jgi:hypothetical protein